jgi:hypothetical protein
MFNLFDRTKLAPHREPWIARLVQELPNSLACHVTFIAHLLP